MEDLLNSLNSLGAVQSYVLDVRHSTIRFSESTQIAIRKDKNPPTTEVVNLIVYKHLRDLGYEVFEVGNMEPRTDRPLHVATREHRKDLIFRFAPNGLGCIQVEPPISKHYREDSRNFDQRLQAFHNVEDNQWIAYRPASGYNYKIIPSRHLFGIEPKAAKIWLLEEGASVKILKGANLSREYQRIRDNVLIASAEYYNEHGIDNPSKIEILLANFSITK